MCLGNTRAQNVENFNMDKINDHYDKCGHIKTFLLYLFGGIMFVIDKA